MLVDIAHRALRHDFIHGADRSRHKAQPARLYETLAELTIFGVLYRSIQKPHAPGAIISLYLVLYGAARFVVEFFRYHEQGNLWGGPLDTSQWISLALLSVGAAYFVRARTAPAPAR